MRRGLTFLFVLTGLARIGSSGEVQAQEAPQVGYALLGLTQGQVLPEASALFAVYSGATLVSEAGVGAVAPIQRGRVFIDQSDTTTGIALANPYPAELSLRLQLRDL